jgi:hypothetical protein
MLLKCESHRHSVCQQLCLSLRDKCLAQRLSMHQHIFYFVYSVTAWAEVTANLGLERIQLCGENRGGVVVRKEGCVVKERNLLVRTEKTVVKKNQFITPGKKCTKSSNQAHLLRTVHICAHFWEKCARGNQQMLLKLVVALKATASVCRS